MEEIRLYRVPNDELLRSIPGHWITGVQINDGAAKPPPGRDPLEDTANHRKTPGKGEFRVRELVALLRESGGLNNLGLEVFSPSRRGSGLKRNIFMARSL